jgi:hypothetical protein
MRLPSYQQYIEREKMPPLFILTSAPEPKYKHDKELYLDPIGKKFLMAYDLFPTSQVFSRVTPIKTYEFEGTCF